MKPLVAEWIGKAEGDFAIKLARLARLGYNRGACTRLTRWWNS